MEELVCLFQINESEVSQYYINSVKFVKRVFCYIPKCVLIV